MKPASYNEYRSAIQGLSLPLAWCDLDRFDANVDAIAARAGTKTIRVATKSVRCVELLQRIAARNPKFKGWMCYSGAEAVWLSQLGFDDLLVAYPVWQAAQVRAICAEVRAGKRIVVMVDCAAHVEHLAQIAAAEGIVLPICMDLDMSMRLPGLHFGVHRSPVTSVEGALQLHQSIKAAPQVKLVGLMGYEAQVAGLGDRIPGQRLKNIAIRALKRRSIKKVATLRAAVVQALQADGAAFEFVNGGGVGSMEFTREESAVTEIAAGSGFYQSHLFDYYDNFRHTPAAGYAVEIVRQPAPGIWTCHGGGYIASGSIAAEKAPKPYLPEGATLDPNEGAGEVQTPVTYRGDMPLALGDPIFFRHSKAGELCERFTELVLLQGGKVAGTSKTYRGDGQCFV